MKHGESASIFCCRAWNEGVRQTFTFSCPREIYIINYKLGTSLLIMRFIIGFYVLTQLYANYSYMEPMAVNMNMGGWANTGTMYSGEGQTYTDMEGAEQPLNIEKPHYCTKGLPYSADYWWGDNEHYTNMQCLALPVDSMWLKELPTSMHFRTFVTRSVITNVAANPPHPTCNSNTTGAVTRPYGAVMCKKSSLFYTINPEGMNVFFKPSFVAVSKSGSRMDGGIMGVNSVKDGKKTNLKVTHIIQKHNGEVFKKFSPTRGYFKFPLQTLLSLAGPSASLDHRAPASANEGDGDPDPPFNRFTGITIVINFHYINYGMEEEVGETWSFWPAGQVHDFVCIVTATHVGDWTSTGSTLQSFQEGPELMTATNDSRIHERPSVIVVYFLQNVQLIFQTTNSVGAYSNALFLAKIIEGVVMLGIAVQITKFIASHFMHSDGVSPIFQRYQNTQVSVKRARARTASLAGLQTDGFFDSFDKKRTGHMSNRHLFNNLRLVMGDPKENSPDGQESMNDTALTLTLEQIAEIVSDVAHQANKHGAEHQDAATEEVSLNEYMYLTGDDSCDLSILFEIYKTKQGNPEYLKFLLDGEIYKPKLPNDELALYRNSSIEQGLDDYRFDSESSHSYDESIDGIEMKRRTRPVATDVVLKSDVGRPVLGLSGFEIVTGSSTRGGSTLHGGGIPSPTSKNPMREEAVPRSIKKEKKQKKEKKEKKAPKRERRSHDEEKEKEEDGRGGERGGDTTKLADLIRQSIPGGPRPAPRWPNMV